MLLEWWTKQFKLNNDISLGGVTSIENVLCIKQGGGGHFHRKCTVYYTWVGDTSMQNVLFMKHGLGTLPCKMYCLLNTGGQTSQTMYFVLNKGGGQFHKKCNVYYIRVKDTSMQNVM